MAKKNNGFKLGPSYFNYQSRNCVIQSVWMMGLWIDLCSKDHLRLKEEFPAELSTEDFQIGEKHVCKKWEEEAIKNENEIIKELEGFKPYFSDDPMKETALTFLILNADYGDYQREEPFHEAPFREKNYAENKNSFYLQSRYYYHLSLCYKYFFEIQKAVEELFGISGDKCFLHIHKIDQDLWYATGDILSHWQIKDKRRRDSKKGGSVAKRLPGILSAVKTMLQDNEKQSYSAERLWKYFEKHHKGESNSLEVNGFKVYFDHKNTDSDEERLFQISKAGIVESVGRSAFNGYVKEVKNLK